LLEFLGVLGALGVSDRLCVLFSDPFAAPGAGSGGSPGTISKREELLMQPSINCRFLSPAVGFLAALKTVH
jgi:hypothetical protein